MIPIRVVKAVMAFLCSANIYVSRTNVNIGIIKMVRPKSTTGGESSTCHRNTTTMTALNATEAESEWEFDWDDAEQGNMLGAYFYGYAAGMPLGGFWTTRYGPSRTTLVSMTIGTVLTFLYPFLITTNYQVGFAARILLGFAHSPNFPAVQGSWHPWAPITEKTKLVTSMFLGVPAGSLIMSTLGGRLCLWYGWRSVFWFAGIVNVVFVILWFIFVTDTPEEHRLISEREKAFIIASRVKQGAKNGKSIPPPIKNFFTSLPMVACWVAHTTSLYAVYCVILFFPKYLRDIQGFNIKEIGDLAAMPQALVVFVIFGGGFISDKLHARRVPLIKIRRVMNFMGSVVPALICTCFFFVHCDIVSAMAVMIIVQTLVGLQHPSSKANFNDVVPPYAATAMAIGNTFASIMGFVAPAIAGFLLKTFGNTVAIWNMIWLICACVLLGGGLFFTFCSSAEPVPWATDDGVSNDENNDEAVALKK